MQHSNNNDDETSEQDDTPEIEVSNRAKEQAEVTGADPEDIQFAMNCFGPDSPVKKSDESSGASSTQQTLFKTFADIRGNEFERCASLANCGCDANANRYFELTEETKNGDAYQCQRCDAYAFIPAH